MMIKKAALISTLSTLSLAVATEASAAEFTVGDTTASVYGYAKLDIAYDVGDIKAGSRGLGNSIGFSRIAVGDAPSSSGHTTMHAYQSRLGFKTTTPTQQGDLVTVIEGDFYGDGGGTFRLRHAYGSWNGITAGQTWTNFGSFVGDTPTLDFTGPVGRAGINRQAQLRYSVNHFHIALEAPNGALSGNSFDGSIDPDNIVLDADRKDSLPDLTLRYEAGTGSVNYATGAVLRQVAFDDGDVDDSTLGWGAFAGGNVELGSATTLRALVSGGEGIGAYMNNSPAPAAYRVGDELETITGWGGTVGLSQEVGIGAINVAYSYAESDWDEALDDGLSVSGRDEERELMYLNYIWSPTERVTYGVEVAHATRTTVAGDDGAATRIQGSVIYSF